jgi:hypothetical protein
MKCSYCAFKFKDDAVVNKEWFIMPTKEEVKIVKGKVIVPILKNKIACYPCLLQISKGQIKA